MSEVPMEPSAEACVNGHAVNSSETEEIEQEIDFDEALKLADCGKYHIMLIAIGGSVYIAYGCQNLLSSYVIPAARCDLSLNSSEKGYLNAAYLLGSVIGLSLWGTLADSIGRHRVIVTSLILDSSISFVSCFSTSFKALVFGRLLNGAILSGAGSLVCPYVAEFTTEKFAPLFLSCIGILYSLSSVLLSTLGINISPGKNTNYFNSWRIFELTPSIVSFLSAVLMIVFLPESPKYLHTRGQDVKALTILKNVYKCSNGRKNDFPVKKLIPVKANERKEVISEGSSFFKIIFLRLWIQYSSLFKKAHILDTLLLIALMFCNMIAYQGMGNWLPELIDRFEEHHKLSNESMTLCEITETYKIKRNFTEICLTRNSDPEVYRQTYFIAVGSVIGAVVNSLIVFKIGFRASSVASSIVASVLILTVYFLKDTMSVAIVSSFFLLMLQNACMCFIGCSCELFPTKIRGAATCTAVMAGRLGAAVSNVLFGHYLDTYCEVPIFVAIGCTTASGLMSFLLPKTFLNRYLQELRLSMVELSKLTTELHGELNPNFEGSEKALEETHSQPVHESVKDTQIDPREESLQIIESTQSVDESNSGFLPNSTSKREEIQTASIDSHISNRSKTDSLSPKKSLIQDSEETISSDSIFFKSKDPQYTDQIPCIQPKLVTVIAVNEEEENQSIKSDDSIHDEKLPYSTIKDSSSRSSSITEIQSKIIDSRI